MDVVVTPLSSPLERLADQIRSDLDRREQGREAWIIATLDLCQHLAEARAEITSDIDFGRWCEAQSFRLNAHDRAAAIQMGQHIPEARPVLEQTERRSLRLIYDLECRFGSDAIPPPVTATKPKAPRPSRTMAEIREDIASGLLAGKSQLTVECEINLALPKKERIGPAIVRRVRAELLGEGKLPDPAKAKIDRLRAEFRAEIAAEMEATIRQRVVERGAQYRDAMKAREAEAERIKGYYEMLTNRHRPPLTNEEFMLLHLCVRGQAGEENQHRAGVLLNEKRAVLTGQKP
jgi:hypothetical protein